LFIPAAEGGRRSYAFLLLAVYVASALGLLLTTSFLGLRRYLRQRKLQMPAAMTATWIGMGTALAVALLLVALLIPRPQGEYTITDWIEKADTKAREASRLALLRDGKAEGEGRRIGEQDPNAKQPGQQPPPDQKPAGQHPRDNQPQQQNQAQDADRQQADQRGGGKAQDQPGDQDGQKRAPGGEQPGQNGNQQAQGRGQGQEQGQGQQQSQGQGQRPGQQHGPGGKNAKADAAAQKGAEQDGRQKQQANQQPNQDQQANRQPNQNQQQADANQRRDAKQNDANNKDRQLKQGEQQRGQNDNVAKQPPPSSTPPYGSMLTNLLTSVAPFVKWILYCLLAAVVIYVLYRHWARFLETLRNLWNELLSLFGFGARSEDSGGPEKPMAATEPPQPFSSFNDPFLNGTARRMPPVQLVQYTFEALEAWSREQGVPRSPEQTPLEFATELGRRLPKASKEISETALIYVQVAYARRKTSEKALDILERMWRRMNVLANV
jgi:hypothetical protein